MIVYCMFGIFEDDCSCEYYVDNNRDEASFQTVDDSQHDLVRSSLKGLPSRFSARKKHFWNFNYMSKSDVASLRWRGLDMDGSLGGLLINQCIACLKNHFQGLKIPSPYISKVEADMLQTLKESVSRLICTKCVPSI